MQLNFTMRRSSRSMRLSDKQEVVAPENCDFHLTSQQCYNDGMKRYGTVMKGVGPMLPPTVMQRGIFALWHPAVMRFVVVLGSLPSRFAPKAPGPKECLEGVHQERSQESLIAIPTHHLHNPHYRPQSWPWSKATSITRDHKCDQSC